MTFLSTRRVFSSALTVVALLFVAAPGVHAQTLSEMTGCWVSEDFNKTSLLTDSTDQNSAQLVTEKMLLRFEIIAGTQYLVLGRIYEWDKAGTYVLGPIYQNGAFNPAARFLTFGSPRGGLDHVTVSAPDRLLYVHTKSSYKSGMSVRPLLRIDCGKFANLEAELLRRKKSLR